MAVWKKHKRISGDRPSGAEEATHIILNIHCLIICIITYDYNMQKLHGQANTIFYARAWNLIVCWRIVDAQGVDGFF